MVDVDRIDANRRHWYREEHFAAQLGNPSARAVVENRWRIFSAEIGAWLRTYGSQRGGAPLRVLDAGCGDGINLVGLSRIFADHAQPIELLGVDYNELRIERARTLKVADRLTVGSLEDVGLAAASVDFVLLNHVLEHVAEKGILLAALRRVMRPGALLIVGVPNEGCALARLRNHVLQRSVLRTTDHVHFFTAPQVRRDLSAAGLVVDRIVGEGFFVPHLRISSFVSRFAAGRRLLAGLGKAVPSQAAGLIAFARVPSGAST